MTTVVSSYPRFNKYNRIGNYHWRQTDPDWGNTRYNAGLVARYSALLHHIPPTDQMILDIGCGDGYLLHLLHQKGFNRAVGIDSDLCGIQLAREQLQKYNSTDAWHLNLCSVYKLPFSTATFDTVVMADVIEHLEEPGGALNEMMRILKEGSLLVLSTPYLQTDRVWDKLHVREYSAEGLQSILAPFFHEVVLYACWPMWCCRLWERGGKWKKLLNMLARLGFNPFAISTKRVTSNYGQLIAVCCK